jgi:hypothetical protein
LLILSGLWIEFHGLILGEKILAAEVNHLLDEGEQVPLALIAVVDLIFVD